MPVQYVSEAPCCIWSSPPGKVCGICLYYAHLSPLARICHHVEGALMMLQEALYAFLQRMHQDRLGIPGIACVQDMHLQARLIPLSQPNHQRSTSAKPAKAALQASGSTRESMYRGKVRGIWVGVTCAPQMWSLSWHSGPDTSSPWCGPHAGVCPVLNAASGTPQCWGRHQSCAVAPAPGSFIQVCILRISAVCSPTNKGCRLTARTILPVCSCLDPQRMKCEGTPALPCQLTLCMQQTCCLPGILDTQHLVLCQAYHLFQEHEPSVLDLQHRLHAREIVSKPGVS